jgi:hypothetical protein
VLGVAHMPHLAYDKQSSAVPLVLAAVELAVDSIPRAPEVAKQILAEGVLGVSPGRVQAVRGMLKKLMLELPTGSAISDKWRCRGLNYASAVVAPQSVAAAPVSAPPPVLECGILVRPDHAWKYTVVDDPKTWEMKNGDAPKHFSEKPVEERKPIYILKSGCGRRANQRPEDKTTYAEAVAHGIYIESVAVPHASFRSFFARHKTTESDMVKLRDSWKAKKDFDTAWVFDSVVAIKDTFFVPKGANVQVVYFDPGNAIAASDWHAEHAAAKAQTVVAGGDSSHRPGKRRKIEINWDEKVRPPSTSSFAKPMAKRLGLLDGNHGRRRLGQKSVPRPLLNQCKFACGKHATKSGLCSTHYSRWYWGRQNTTCWAKYGATHGKNK